MLRSISKRTVAVAATSVLAIGVSALPASAATNQSGLVNVSASDVNVPIGVAANVCQVQANVLAANNFQDTGVCSAISTPTASGGGGGGNTNQSGLVNISLSDINIPIGVAANVCQVQANVLASGNFTSPGRCSAITTPTATG
jgi:hypothetical protein